MDIFQKIIDKELPATIIYEDKSFIAFNDIKPIAPGHFLVVPKEFSENLIDIDDANLSKLVVKAKELALQAIEDLEVSGFKLQINNGKESGQEVMRTHIHIIPSIK